MIWAIKLFRPYIYGALFEIQTDHFALKWLMMCKDLQGKLARWSLKLQAYNMIVTHKRGCLHRNVDALSRVEVSPARYLAGMTSSLYDLDTDSDEGEPANCDSEDSFEDFTEVERLHSWRNETDLLMQNVRGWLTCLKVLKIL